MGASSKLESCLSKLNSKYGYAFNALMTCKLTGAETRTYSYSLTAGAGKDEMEHKWDMDLHLQNQNKKVCMAGAMKYPTTPSSQAIFQYENKLGFGETCEEYFVNIEGKSMVSEQKSQNSKESQKCQSKSEEGQQLRQSIKTIQEEEEKKKVEKKHAKVSLEKLKYCGKKTQQSRTVDYP